MDTVRYYLPGITFILIGIMILAVPEIFIAFIGITIVIGGIIALHIGHKIRESGTELRNHLDNWFSDEDYFGSRYVRIPVFRDYRKWL